MLNLIRNTRPFQSVLTIILAALLFLGVAGVNNALANHLGDVNGNLVGKMKGSLTCLSNEGIEKDKVKSILHLVVWQAGHHITINGIIENPDIEFEAKGLGFLVNPVKGVFMASTENGLNQGVPFLVLNGNFKIKDGQIDKVWGSWEIELHNDIDNYNCIGMGKFGTKQEPIE
jgi:hypothetical protein